MQAELNQINTLDKERDAALAAACGGKTPDLCTLEQKKVRSFAADVILKGDKDIIFGADGKHTLSEAMGTFDKGRLLVQTAKGTFVSVLDGYIETLKTGLEIAQDPVGSAKKLGAQAQVVAQETKEALEWIANNPIKFKEIAQATENQLRSDLANAIQNGDESSIGQMLGDVLANFSPDPLKKVKALNKVVDEVKLAKKAEMKLSPIVGEVDEFGRLRSGDVVGDQLENHHVPQKAIAKNSVVDYPKDKDAVTAPAIRLSEEDHLLITKLQKANQAQRSKMTARELLADDARMLRSIGVENAKIAQIIEMNKAKYGFTK